MKITEFFKKEYVDQASYDNLRKIASLVDGQKNASRKIIYTILEKNIKEKIKVSQLNSKAAEFAEYLHGSMDNVIVNLAQDFTGTNNMPLLHKKGNFGTRFTQEASASRYIYTFGSDNLFNLFNKNDTKVLLNQYFEGYQIEPMFYVPNLPVLLLNGSEGVSSGFAQKILPRNPKDIKEFISSFLKSKKLPELKPWYSGFKGTIEQGENNKQWLIKGKISRVNKTKILIEELPIGYDLKTYIGILDDLEDKKYFNSYVDKSEDDIFKFEINFTAKYLDEVSEDELLNKLKLIKKVSENYTCIDENNKIKVFENVNDILANYISVKLQYLQKRKDFQVQELENNIKLDYSRYTFIKNIVDGNLIINKRKKSDIEKDLDVIVNILKKDSSYDYLLNMNILSLTEERLDRLLNDIKTKKAELDKLKTTDIKDIWLAEIKAI